MVALVSQENVVTLVSRTGRELQRYRKGRRQVVGFVSSISSVIFSSNFFYRITNFVFCVYADVYHIDSKLERKNH